MSNLELIRGKKNLGKSVGSIIQNEKGEYLALYRLKHPVGLAFIAGHVDPGETPPQANIREADEEGAIAVEEQEEVLHRTYDHKDAPCAKGHNGHEWWVYRVTKFGGEPHLVEDTKHRFVKWMSWDGILEYIARDDVDPGWKVIFRDLGMLK